MINNKKKEERQGSSDEEGEREFWVCQPIKYSLK